MTNSRLSRIGLIILAFICLVPRPVAAQQTSAIAGVVRDTSGAVLPGVTVEAASPVLIEKVRTVVTDDQGRYNIVDLRPGVYRVTFTLPGFNTLAREGVELSSGFTAAVNAEMPVGALQETVTVSGASPLVDTQNVRKQTLITSEQLDALPTSTRTGRPSSKSHLVFLGRSPTSPVSSIRTSATRITARPARNGSSTACQSTMPAATSGIS